MPESIDVFYLARKAQGWDLIRNFAASYLTHSAGIEHELVLLAKGFEKRTERYLLSEMFNIPLENVIYVDENIGQDIHSYKYGAGRRKAEFMCFLNSYSQVEAPNWLLHLYEAIRQDDVGMAGATGSFESLYNSYALISAVSERVHRPARFSADFLGAFKWIVASMASPAYPVKLLNKKPGSKKRIKRAIADAAYARPPHDDFPWRPSEDFRSNLSPGKVFEFLPDIPAFPNPHIRSNGFMVRRKDFLSIPLDGDKQGCVLFESGLSGLSAAIIASNRRLVLVDRNGKIFDIPDWPKSNTFRGSSDALPLVSDNQTRNYTNYSMPERLTHDLMSWGAYGGFGEKRYGIPFDNYKDLQDFMPRRAPEEDAPRVTFSVVLPSHDRNQLVLDAIYSVREQDYEDWELVVFDNASSQPLEQDIAKLGDPRIRVERSENLLPVTDSWNRAFSMAKGDYVVMVGDDDGLCPGYFTRMKALIDRFDRPDAIFSGLLQFFHPGVHPVFPGGRTRMMATGEFMEYKDDAFVFPLEPRMQQVENSLHFRRTFHFNMPAFTTKKAFLDRISIDGKLLHPPFPDYYFANLVFAKAGKLVVDPRANAFQGVSRKSFGFTLLNQSTEKGFEVLGHATRNDEMFPKVGSNILPGNEYMAHYLLTMARLGDVVGQGKLQPDTKRYRRIRVLEEIQNARKPRHWARSETGRAIYSQLSLSEKLWAYKASRFLRWSKKRPDYFQNRFERISHEYDFYPFKPYTPDVDDGNFIDGRELYDALRSRTMHLPRM